MGKLKCLHLPPAFFGPADPPADVKHYSLAIRQRLPSPGTTRHLAFGCSLESRLAIVQAVRLLG